MSGDTGLVSAIQFYIVDVFAVGRYTGNQLAVFLNAENLSATQMQLLAREMNYSETTFVLGSCPQANSGGWRVRIFTPAAEIPFAGHPTLGTAAAIDRFVATTPQSTLQLDLAVGAIAVRIDRAAETVWMRQPQPEFTAPLTADRIAQLAAVLGLEPAEIDARFPVQAVSTGLPFFIVPLKTLAALRSIRTNREAYFDFIAETTAKNILAFCPQTRQPENQLSVRVFCDYLGIPEDPATGSANGCLAAYLAKHEYFGTAAAAVRVEQGHEMQRPSLLFLEAAKTATGIAVSVGGQVVPIARGELLL
ncbi:MAG: PhzF family phenazine biosynthesis protein [Cyanobacteria bacterium J06641_5]